MMSSSSGPILLVIPARLSSTRLPRKLMLAETGKPLIQHVWEAARRSTRATQVVVGSEDSEIVDAIRGCGGEAVLTGKHASGTDRVAEVARKFRQASIVVNVQGDEPEIAAQDIDLAISLLQEFPDVAVSTLAAPIREASVLANPACVKVVTNEAGRAMWFSRSPIPFARDPSKHSVAHEPPLFCQHLGLYAYRVDFLEQFARLPPSRMELVEGLEQLRVLEAGYAIQVGFVPRAFKGIDTAEDYHAFVERYRASGR